MSGFRKYIAGQWFWSRMRRAWHVPRMGPEGIARLGYRNYVGGMWEELGRLQFDFLVAQGLRPEHMFYDIGCGALRGGVHFIGYLEPEHYCGLDREAELVRLGLLNEVSAELVETKRPIFVISRRFEMDAFPAAPDFALAQSLFTHLTLRDIQACLRALRAKVTRSCRFYATFFEKDVTPCGPILKGKPNPPASHSNLPFYYHRQELERCAWKTGWGFTYIGDWNHPRGQQMIEFHVRPTVMAAVDAV